MIEKHNKILLAGELLAEAAKIYRQATGNVDYAKSILLAGAAIGIIGPWLDEIGVKSSHVRLAEFAAAIQGIDLSSLPAQEKSKEVGKGISFYRLTYNSLKHAGKGEKIAPSDDLTFQADLQDEAEQIIGDAINDYSRLPLDRETINTKLSTDLLDLLHSPWPERHQQ